MRGGLFWFSSVRLVGPIRALEFAPLVYCVRLELARLLGVVWLLGFAGLCGAVRRLELARLLGAVWLLGLARLLWLVRWLRWRDSRHGGLVERRV